MKRVLPLVLVLAFASSAAAQNAPRAKRPAALMPLYLTSLTLHSLDMHSTWQARDLGHREANPMLQNATDHQMIGAKMAASAVTVLVAETLWRRNRVASVVLMTAVNVALAGVVANNYHIANRPPRR